MRKTTPLYQTVRNRLLERIGSGELGVGDRLEPEIELAQSYGVSRATMRSAIRDLVQDGLLIRRPGVGTMIVRTRPQVRSSALEDLVDPLAARLQDAQVLVLDSSPRPAADEVAAALRCEAGTKLLRVFSICKSGSEPVALCQTWLSPKLEVSAAEPRIAPLYDLLEQTYGLRISHGDDSVGAVAAKGDAARLLLVRAGTPLVSVDRIAYGGDGTPLLYSQAQFRGESYRYAVTLARDVSLS
mgnify:CR=1 FL=1